MLNEQKRFCFLSFRINQSEKAIGKTDVSVDVLETIGID